MPLWYTKLKNSAHHKSTSKFLIASLKKLQVAGTVFLYALCG